MFSSWMIPLLITLIAFLTAYELPYGGDTYKLLDRIVYMICAFGLSVVAWALWLVSVFAL
jgi:hypothetical protein